LLHQGRTTLSEAGLTDARADAEVLLARLLRVERAHLHAHPEQRIRPEIERAYHERISRRASREPLQYITGVQEFWSLTFEVSPAVMIPRPETELIVEACVRLSAGGDQCILDIGTGSGCVAVAVARELPGAAVHATDLSEEALEIARLNAVRNDVAGRITFYQGDLLDPLRPHALEGRADFVLSNPPYIAEADLKTLEPEIRDHEPHLALTPGTDPLVIHRRLAETAPAFLKKGARLIVEFGLGQGPALRDIYGGAPGLEVEEIRPDLSGNERVLVTRSTSGPP
jgi:release factor glutamine methyltransferase